MNAFMKRKWLYIPYIILGLGVVSGTAAWFWGKGKVNEALDAEIAKQKTNGLAISCDNREIGGYPLKYIITCPKFGVNENKVKVTLEKAVFVAQVWNKNHVIAELHAPIVMKIEDQVEPITITSEPIMVSMSGDGKVIKRTSTVFKATKLKNSAFEMSFADGEFHFLEGEDLLKPHYKSSFVFNTINTMVAGKSYPTKVFTLKSDSQLSSRPISNKAEAVFEWFKAGGVMTVNEFSMFADDYGMKINGKINLNAEKLLYGKINLHLWGLDKGLESLKAQGMNDPKLTGMVQGITTFAKKETIEGKNTHKFEFTSEKGQVKMQGLPIYNLPAIK